MNPGIGEPGKNELLSASVEVTWKQSTTRRETLALSNEKFSRESIDFQAVVPHLRIHTAGEVAGSQFNGELFPTPDALLQFLKERLPQELEWDADDRVELTLHVGAEQPVGWSGVQSIETIRAAYPKARLEKRNRISGGESGVVDDIFGAWYPETTRDPETNRFVVATNLDGSIKNPHGKFEPVSWIAEVPKNEFKKTAATQEITLILQKDRTTGQPIPLTIFPGENAPAMPAKIQSDTYNADTLKNQQLVAFWDSHAFIQAVEITTEQETVGKSIEAERQPTPERGYKELKEMFENQEFIDQLVIAQVSREQEALERVHQNLQKVVDQKMRTLKDQAALKVLGLTDLNKARKLGKVWGAALRDVTTIDLQSEAVTETLSVEVAEERFRAEFLDLGNSSYRSSIESSEMALAHAFDRERARADALRIDILARAQDSALHRGLDAWGQSPNAKGDRGPQGDGYNSGVIHFFEYRADLAKRGRFKGEVEFSIDEFIQYSERLKSMIEHFQSSPDVVGAVLLEDDAGQKRLFMITRNAERIVAFQKKGATHLQILSILPSGKIEDLDDYVNDEMDTTSAKYQSRMNKLEGVVRIVYDSRKVQAPLGETVIDGGAQAADVENHGDFNGRIEQLVASLTQAYDDEQAARDEDEAAYYHQGVMEGYMAQQRTLINAIQTLVKQQLESNHPDALKTVTEILRLDRLIDQKKQEFRDSYDTEAYFRAQASLNPYDVSYEDQLHHIQNGGENLEKEISMLERQRQDKRGQLPNIPGIDYLLRR